ncbi:MAG: hypothetical protein ACYS47_16980 [Planctomycetota bacterium]|jgi:hypothetical protein
MNLTAETEGKVLELLTGEDGAPLPVESIFPAERGVYRGYLVLLADRLIFVEDRFGRLERSEEVPYSGAEDVKIRKGMLGWELTARREGRSLRYARLSEEHAHELLGRFDSESGAAPPSAAPRRVRRPPPMVPAPVPAPAEVVPETTDDRVHLIRILSEEPGRTPTAVDLCRQIGLLEVPTLTAPEAADRVLGFLRDETRGEPRREGEAPPTEFPIIPSLVHLIEDLDAPVRFRRLASRFLSTFQERRLLNFLIYHATREKDPGVARDLYEGLARVGGEAAVRCLLKVLRRGLQPFAGEALEVLSETAWIPVVRALVVEVRSLEDPWHVRIAGACARILRLSLTPETEADASGVKRGAAFHDFWADHGHGEPLDLIKASVEGNLEARQSRNTDVAWASEQNLVDLTLGYGRGGIEACETDEDAAFAWVVWWAKTKGRNPRTWLRPRYLEALSIPVSGLGTPAAKEPRTRRDKEEQAKKEKKKAKPLPAGIPSLHWNSAARRALVVAVFSGLFLWGAMKLLGPLWGEGHVGIHIAGWLAVAAAGSFAVGRTSWALKALPWGLASGLLAHAIFRAGAGVVFADLAAWSCLGAGFFKVRKAESGIWTGAILGGATYLAVLLMVRLILELSIPYRSVDLALTAAVFWFAHYTPLVRD